MTDCASNVVRRFAYRVAMTLATLVPVAWSADVGVFYYPGWHSTSRNWADLKGLPESRSPSVAWPDRMPVLGQYAEENPEVAEQHIEWASNHAITFFAYDWYWNGSKPELDHALKAYFAARNRDRLRFSLLWANHSDVPRNLGDFDRMVSVWIDQYFDKKGFYSIDGKPMVFIYSSDYLERNARRFGHSARSLLERARAAAVARGMKGIYFVATTNAEPSNELDRRLADQGFDAYTGWNYVTSSEKAGVADYDTMVDTYLRFYRSAGAASGRLGYLPPASPGWDSRPWHGPNAVVRRNATPEKFRIMLQGARRLLEEGFSHVKPVVMIEAWNEFGEGAYIEPTKGTGFGHLDVVRDAFGNDDSRRRP